MKLLNKVLLLAIFFGFGSLVGWNASVPSATETGKRLCASQIVKHTEIINSIGLSAKTSSEVSDLLMRIRHYTNNHGDTKHWLCPECSKNEKSIVESVPDDAHPDEPEEVPETPEQVMKDLEEINTGVEAIDMGHQLQILFLRSLLKDLQENMPDIEPLLLDDLRWFGDDIDKKIVAK